LLARYLPEELINRPKMGFAVPLNDWLRGPLREWAGELLEPGRLAREGWFRPEPIQRRWLDLQAGGDGHELALWSILMFQAWREHWAPHIAD
jgi:asparagine synthase (glutamine-hydrolysing)